MAGIITLNPGTYLTARGWQNQAAGALSGAATHVNDASDATWAQDVTPHASLNTQLTVDLTDITTLPAGAAVRAVTPKIRVSQAVGAKALSLRVYRSATGDGLGAYGSPLSVITPTSVIKNFSGASGPGLPSAISYGAGLTETPDNYLDGLYLDVQLSPAGRLAEDHRVYKLWVEVEYIDPPTTQTLALVDPADVAITTRPELKWDYASPDGYPQYELRAAIWSLADVTAFPGGRVAFEADLQTNAFGGVSGTSGPRFTTNGGVTYKTAKSWSIPEGGTSHGYVQSSDPNWVPQHDLPATGAMVAYVQTAAQFEGARLKGLSVAILDFTMGLTLPAVPTSVVAVWQYPKAAAGADQNAQYRTKVTVVVPAGALGVFSGRRLYVEHAVDGDDTWHLLPLAMQEVGAGAGNFTFYDTLPLGGRTLRYRARTQLWTNTRVLPSTYTTGNAVNCVIDEFLLRDPLDEDSTLVLRIQGEVEGATGEAQAEFRALGQSLPTILSDAMLGYRFRLKTLAGNDVDSFMLHALRTGQSTLLFQGDMTGWWWWVRMGPETTHTFVRQTNRRNPSKRSQFHDFQLIQTYPISGQPAIWAPS